MPMTLCFIWFLSTSCQTSWKTFNYYKTWSNEKERLWRATLGNCDFKNPYFAVAQSWEKGDVIDESAIISIFNPCITLLLLVITF